MNKTHVITDDFIKANKDLTFKEVFPELFKKFTGWAKDDEEPNWMVYFVDDVARYWIDGKKWSPYPHEYRYSQDACNRPATTKEVVTRLSTHATELGFKKGVKIKSKKSVLKIISDSFIVTDDFKIVVFTDIGSYKIFDDGKWAEIVPEERTYKVGDRVEICDSIYIIGHYKRNHVSLINIEDGVTWSYHFAVKNIQKITSKELDDHIERDWSPITTEN